MAIVWPGTLPDYQEIGLQKSRQQGFLRSPVDAGPAKARKRFSTTSETLNGTMLLNNAQYQVFDDFYKITINEGTDEFEMLDPQDGQPRLMRFVEPPTERALVGGPGGAAEWRVALSLEIVDNV